MKEQVDLDYNGGFPVVSLLMLAGIILVLYSIWN
jgi:hypothetical protein